MIEVAICDDEPLLAHMLERLLQDSAQVIPEPLHIRIFYKGADLLTALSVLPCAGDQPNLLDILFLDIELGDTTGIKIASEIRKRFESTILVFVSAYESYCKELFRYDTFDFLSKPVDALQLQDILRRSYLRLKKPSLFFSYRVKNDTYRVPLAEILYFESVLRKIRIVTLHGYGQFYGKIDDIETSLLVGGGGLSQARFVRIHHSLLINMEHVEKIAKNNILVLHGGHSVPLSRSKAGEVRKQMFAYFKEIDL